MPNFKSTTFQIQDAPADYVSSHFEIDEEFKPGRVVVFQIDTFRSWKNATPTKQFDDVESAQVWIDEEVTKL